MLSKNKKIILDTDIGGDCDDAVALALLHNLMVAEKCILELITLSVNYDGGCATARAINRYYGRAKIPIASSGEKKTCTKRMYATHIKNLYGLSDKPDGECVALLRKVLAESTEKITIIGIGPLSNLAKLLVSGGDSVSSQNGEELIQEKVEAFYIMGGSALEMVEFNIAYDIPAAQLFFEKNKVKTFIIPWEMGRGVYTGETLIKNDNPAGECVSYWNYYQGKNRDSWDPITCAIGALDDNIYKKESIKVHITDNGKTLFTEDSHSNTYLCSNILREQQMKEYLENYLK